MTNRRFSATVMKLLELGTPYYSDGRWRNPTINRRLLREMGKVMVYDGEKWPTKFLRDRGVEKERQFAREKKEEARKQKIEENMKKMPKMIEEYYADRRAKRHARKKKWTDDETYRLAMGKPIREGLKEEATKYKKKF